MKYLYISKASCTCTISNTKSIPHFAILEFKVLPVVLKAARTFCRRAGLTNKLWCHVFKDVSCIQELTLAYHTQSATHVIFWCTISSVKHLRSYAAVYIRFFSACINMSYLSVPVRICLSWIYKWKFCDFGRYMWTYQQVYFYFRNWRLFWSCCFLPTMFSNVNNLHCFIFSKNSFRKLFLLIC